MSHPQLNCWSAVGNLHYSTEKDILVIAKIFAGTKLIVDCRANSQKVSEQRVNSKATPLLFLERLYCIIYATTFIIVKHREPEIDR